MLHPTYKTSVEKTVDKIVIDYAETALRAKFRKLVREKIKHHTIELIRAMIQKTEKDKMSPAMTELDGAWNRAKDDTIHYLQSQLLLTEKE